MIEITVAPDKSEAHLTIIPDPENNKVTADQLLAALKQHQITFGISRKQLFALRDHFNQNPHRRIGAVIARSQPPTETIQPRVKFHFQQQRHGKKVTGKEKIDHKDKGIIRYFQPGEPLLEIFPGRPGRGGRLVDGTIISPQPMKELPCYQAGNGVRLEKSDERIVFRATTAGQARLANNTIEISETFHFNGDVDMETGHIEFAGPVEISGNLKSGFHIFSNADIRIGKTAKGTIKTRGNLIIGGGLIGSAREQVLVGGCLNCEYISGTVNLHVGKTINVTKHIINSNLICNDNVYCEESLSGECQISAFLGLNCGELGSEQGGRVTVKIGDFTTLREKLAKIDEILEPLINESIAMVDQIGLQALMKKDVSALPPEKRPEARKILTRYLEIDSQVNRLKEKRSELEKRIEAGLASRVVVRHYAHADNLIIIGLENYTIKTGLNGPIEFYFDPRKKAIVFERLS